MLLPLSFGLLAAFGFAVMFALAKGLGDNFSGQQLVFFRSIIALLIFIPFFFNNHDLLRTNRPKVHMLRAILGLGSMACLFVAAAKIPFTILTLIIFTMPLFVSLLSFPVLRERVGFLGSLSVVFGFIGIIIAVDPFNEPPNIFLAVALLGSFLYGLAVLSIRQLSKTEPSGTMFFYFTLSCTLGSAMFLPFGWTSPSIIDLLFLCGMGVAGGFGQFAMIKAYKLAPANFVAPIEYTQFIWAVIFGFIFWNEIPTLNIYLGGAIVIICTLLLSKTNHQST